MSIPLVSKTHTIQKIHFKYQNFIIKHDQYLDFRCKSQIITSFKDHIVNLKKDPTELCSCKCHFGGAVSCPGCKENHGEVCCHCKD